MLGPYQAHVSPQHHWSHNMLSVMILLCSTNTLSVDFFYSIGHLLQCELIITVMDVTQTEWRPGLLSPLIWMRRPLWQFLDHMNVLVTPVLFHNVKMCTMCHEWSCAMWSWGHKGDIFIWIVSHRFHSASGFLHLLLRCKNLWYLYSAFFGISDLSFVFVHGVCCIPWQQNMLWTQEVFFISCQVLMMISFSIVWCLFHLLISQTALYKVTMAFYFWTRAVRVHLKYSAQ